RTRNRNYAALFDWKCMQRAKFLAAVAQHEPTPTESVWGDHKECARLADSGLPWFAFGGRDDPRQRGHDVAARAISEFLNRQGEAQFLFFPIPGDEGLA